MWNQREHYYFMIYDFNRVIHILPFVLIRRRLTTLEIILLRWKERGARDLRNMELLNLEWEELQMKMSWEGEASEDFFEVKFKLAVVWFLNNSK
jgi:hypothetical protein